ncbi:DUF2589 domain-containing protein [Thiothrix winogradskyi]|uniref:DUF2589 domain-containing protein n=1 Tax=Thiothrix winogradskyi TaxID=96472 RepID=A0ABY3T0P3_9GAMM|nr:DUF2589 domain-containing protein [Thiothrix winogradskyi]UJS25069.1 DUF2589 domain-containing protein [Thiothrix winogradskyi]
MLDLNHGKELSSIDFASMIGGPLVAVVDAQAAAAISTVDFIKSVGFYPDTKDSSGKTIPGDPVYVTFKFPKLIPGTDAVTGAITGVTVSDQGSGYASSPAVSVSGGGGSGAVLEAILDSEGKVVEIRIVSAGRNYATAPTLTLDPPPAGSGTSTATATATVGNVSAQPAKYQNMELQVPMLTIVPIPYLRVEEVEIKFNAKINSFTYENSSTSSRFDAAASASAGWGWGKAKISASYSTQKSSSSGTQVNRTYSLDIRVRAEQDELPGGMEKVLGILEGAMREVPALSASTVPATT